MLGRCKFFRRAIEINTGKRLCTGIIFLNGLFLLFAVTSRATENPKSFERDNCLTICLAYDIAEGFNPDLKPYSYNPEIAKKLLKTSDFPSEHVIKIYTNQNDLLFADGIPVYFTKLGLKTKYVNRIQEIHFKEVPIIFGYAPDEYYTVTDNVKNFVPSMTGMLEMHDIILEETKR